MIKIMRATLHTSLPPTRRTRGGLRGELWAGGLSPVLLHGQRPRVDGGVPLWFFIRPDRRLTGGGRGDEVGFLGVVPALVPPLVSLGPDTIQEFPQGLSMGRLGRFH